MQSEPTPQHRWLEQLVGNWTFETEASMGPDQPPMKATGTQTTRMLGGLWMLGEAQSDMGTMLFTLGFDSKAGHFVGSFISSMGDMLWTYDNGWLDNADKVLTLEANGPNFEQTGIAPYQDSFEIVDGDHHILRSQIQQADGSWLQFMTSHYRRVG
jgi:hypothetical protein